MRNQEKQMKAIERSVSKVLRKHRVYGLVFVNTFASRPCVHLPLAETARECRRLKGSINELLKRIEKTCVASEVSSLTIKLVPDWDFQDKDFYRGLYEKANFPTGELQIN